MIRDPLDLGQTLGARVLKERHEDMLPEPGYRLVPLRDLWERVRNGGRAQVPEHARLASVRLVAAGKLHREDPFMHNAAESVDHPRPVEVDPSAPAAGRVASPRAWPDPPSGRPPLTTPFYADAAAGRSTPSFLLG